MTAERGRGEAGARARVVLGALVIYLGMASLAHVGLVRLFRLGGMALARLDGLLLAGFPAVALVMIFRGPLRGRPLGRLEGACWMLWAACSFFGLLAIRPPAYVGPGFERIVPSRSPRLLVHAFENGTGDPGLDWAGWGAALVVAEALDLTPGIAARLAPQQLMREVGPAPWQGMQVGRATDRLVGRLERRGEGLVLALRLVDMDDGAQLGGVDQPLETNDVLGAAEEAALRLRMLLGRGRDAMVGPPARSERERAAFRAYARAVLAQARGRNDRAALRYQEALAVDPGHLGAYGRLARLAPVILDVASGGIVFERRFVEVFNGGRSPMFQWAHRFAPGLRELRSLDGAVLAVETGADGVGRVRLRPPLDGGERLFLAASHDGGLRCGDPGLGRFLSLHLAPAKTFVPGTGRELAPVGPTHDRPFACLLRLPPGAVVLACEPPPDSAFRHAGRLHLGWSRFLPEGLSLPCEIWFDTDPARAQQVLSERAWPPGNPWPRRPREAWLDALQSRARLAFLLGEQALARRELHRLLNSTRDPLRLFRAHALLGQSLGMQGRRDSLDSLMRAWALFPEAFDEASKGLPPAGPGPWNEGQDGNALRLAAESLHRRGRDDEATASLRASLALWPENPWAHRLLAERAVRWRSPDRVNWVAAMLHGERALRVPRAWVAAEWSRMALARGDLQTAFDLGKKALVEAHPPLDRLWARVLDTGMRLDPHRPPLGALLACRPPEEAEGLRAVVEALVLTRLASRHLAGTESLLRAALLRWPAEAGLHELLGRVAATEKRWDEALVAFETARALDARRLRALYWVATVQMATGRRAEARRSAEAYLKASAGMPGEESWRARARELVAGL